MKAAADGHGTRVHQFPVEHWFDDFPEQNFTITGIQRRCCCFAIEEIIGATLEQRESSSARIDGQANDTRRPLSSSSSRLDEPPGYNAVGFAVSAHNCSEFLRLATPVTQQSSLYHRMVQPEKVHILAHARNLSVRREPGDALATRVSSFERAIFQPNELLVTAFQIDA